MKFLQSSFTILNLQKCSSYLQFEHTFIKQTDKKEKPFESKTGTKES